MNENEKKPENSSFKRQVMLYFFFALCMIALNYVIQKSNQIFFAPFLCENLGQIGIIQTFYCSKNPYNMPELVGSIIAVGITYITKFLLDKFIVFQNNTVELKETTQEFIKYFVFAIFTTIENIGIQFLMTNFIGTPLEISMAIALSIGYITKFFLDKKYVFFNDIK
jgi:putative flippase GtrA